MKAKIPLHEASTDGTDLGSSRSPAPPRLETLIQYFNKVEVIATAPGRERLSLV